MTSGTWSAFLNSFAPAGARNSGGITNLPKYISFDNSNTLTLSNAADSVAMEIKVQFELVHSYNG
jgi:hypothetical protein